MSFCWIIIEAQQSSEIEFINNESKVELWWMKIIYSYFFFRLSIFLCVLRNNQSVTWKISYIISKLKLGNKL